jgi:hypothetical protein
MKRHGGRQMARLCTGLEVGDRRRGRASTAWRSPGRTARAWRPARAFMPRRRTPKHIAACARTPAEKAAKAATNRHACWRSRLSMRAGSEIGACTTIHEATYRPLTRRRSDCCGLNTRGGAAAAGRRRQAAQYTCVARKRFLRSSETSRSPSGGAFASVSSTCAWVGTASTVRGFQPPPRGPMALCVAAARACARACLRRGSMRARGTPCGHQRVALPAGARQDTPTTRPPARQRGQTAVSV